MQKDKYFIAFLLSYLFIFLIKKCLDVFACFDK